MFGCKLNGTWLLGQATLKTSNYVGMKGWCRSSNLRTAGVASTSNYILMATWRAYLV
jgi:hypothetical protein